MTVYNENINTSPRGPRPAARSRQHSTNSLFAKTFESPSKRPLYSSDGAQKPPTKNGSPHRDGHGAPDHHLHTQARGSSLAPVGANMRAAPRSHQDTKEITVAATPSTLSSLQRTGSKTDGLRLHWDDVASTKSSLPDSARTSHEQDSNSGHHLAYLSAQDLSIPDLRDSEISPLDSHFLLSPFTMSEPNFNKSTVRASSNVVKPSPASQADSPAARAPPPVNTGTPTSPPRKPFFQTGSTGSFSRFPTPDKLSLGFTPSPVQEGDHLPGGLLLPPISPSGPMLAENSSLLRSLSSQTIQSDASSSGSLNTSSSSSSVSDILKANASTEPIQSSSQTIASSSRSGRRDGLSRSTIRESLLSFPSPPTSPRPFTFGKAADSLLPARSAGESSSSSSQSALLGSALHESTIHEEHGTDELQSSIDESLAGAGGINGLNSLSTKTDFPAFTLRSSSMPPGGVNSNFASRSRPSSSLPPNMALPPLPPISKLTLGQGDSPALEMPASNPEASLSASSASYVRPILPLRTPQMAVPPSEPVQASVQQAAQISESTTAMQRDETLPRRVLRPSKSTESFIGVKARHVTPAQRPPMPKSDSTASSETPKQTRRRRASLSIKIPKMFSKSRKLEDDLHPQSAMSPNSLQLPQSRFSPDSDGPTPISERAPVNIFRRLSRAASSPNLKASVADAASRQASRKDHFVPPASAPPVPTAFIAATPGDTSNGTPLPTPSLVTDIDSSMGSDSPRVGGSAENDSAFARMQNYNPYFPKFPPRQSSLILSPGGLQDSRSPSSPQDMGWLHSPPAGTQAQGPPVPSIVSLQNKPMATLAASDSNHSDSGSASMPSEEPTRGKTASKDTRPAGTRRSTLSGSSNGDDEEDEEDAYGGQSLSSDDYTTSSEEEDDDEESSEGDDVPLAETHPDALKVQFSLRAKVKRDAAKKKKCTDKVTGRSRVRGHKDTEKSEEAQAQPASVVPAPQRRQDGQSLSQRASLSRPAAQPVNKRNPFGFAPDELSDKLKKLDASHGRLNSLRQPAKRPDSAGERPHDLLLPQTDEHVKHRSSSKGRANLAPPLAPFVQDSVLTMSEGSDDEVAPLRIKKRPQPAPLSAVIPPSHALMRQPASEASSIPASPRSPNMSQHERSFSALHPTESIHRTMPPHQQHCRPSFKSRQRVYINDPQHHCTVEIDETMTAAMLLAQLRAKNAISPNPAWTVTEIWRAMGVERPLREYELLQESIESWSSEANSSLLLVKKSPLAPLLSNLSKNRSDTETTSGWVYLEVKHGKWSKRYIDVRNGAMYIGKSEKQRDHTILCHFSNFDAYIVPQACIAKMKTPKPFAFAVKSVDKVSLFENADQDYIHFFSVKTEAERDMWIQHILESRSKLVKQIAASRAAAQLSDTRTNLMAHQMAHQPHHGMQQMHQHRGNPGNTSSSVSRTASNSSTTPPMPSHAAFGDPSLLARRPSNGHHIASETKKIISAENLPPMPGAVPTGTFATIPRGRDWERLGPEDKRALIHEAARKARDEGKALLDFGETHDGAGLLGRARAKSIGQRR